MAILSTIRRWHFRDHVPIRGMEQRVRGCKDDDGTTGQVDASLPHRGDRQR